MKKTALHLKTTLARAPIYDRAHPEKLWSASPGNPVGAPQHSLSLLFVQPDKKSLEESTRLERTYFLTYSSNKRIKKVHSESKLQSKPTAIHVAYYFLN